MQLHEIPRGSLIKAQTINSDTKEILGEFITFHHTDGMYSYCTVYGSKMEHVIHLGASTELEKVSDYYVIKKQYDIYNKRTNRKTRKLSEKL